MPEGKEAIAPILLAGGSFRWVKFRRRRKASPMHTQHIKVAVAVAHGFIHFFIEDVIRHGNIAVVPCWRHPGINHNGIGIRRA